MRVVAGTLRGRRLDAPAGTATRPTSDRVREALFAILGSVDGDEVLDLFAGSGALGIEALSRGARSATFVEIDPAAIQAIRANVALVDDPDRIRIEPQDWRVALRRAASDSRTFDLCFLDPPYADLPAVLEDLGPALGPVLADGAVLAIEHDARRSAVPVVLPGLAIASRTDRTYGRTGIVVCRMEPRR
jgi:16S rRNA (guanine966-N2)-methyltransferase